MNTIYWFGLIILGALLLAVPQFLKYNFEISLGMLFLVLGVAGLIKNVF